LKSIIAHELGHHAAGHTSPWKGLLLMPINFIPFLSNFYSRCCEYTCDRISYAIVRDKEAVQRSLLTLAHGTQSLADKSDLAEFCAQEREIPALVGFYLEVLATHPRITRRIAAIESFASAYTG
jgi:Zn-dependent protease with chaperone function